MCRIWKALTWAPSMKDDVADSSTHSYPPSIWPGDIKMKALNVTVNVSNKQHIFDLKDHLNILYKTAFILIFFYRIFYRLLCVEQKVSFTVANQHRAMEMYRMQGENNNDW